MKVFTDKLTCMYFANGTISSGLLAGVVSGDRTFSHSFTPCICKVKVLTQGQSAQAKNVSELCQTLNEVSLRESTFNFLIEMKNILWSFHVSYFMRTLNIHLVDWHYVVMISYEVQWDSVPELKATIPRKIKITSSAMGFLVERFKNIKLKYLGRPFLLNK